MPITTYPLINASSAVGVMQYGNTVTNDLFMPVMILVIWIVLFVTMKSWNTDAAAGASLFVTMLITVLLRVANLMSDGVTVFVILACVVAMFFVVFNRG